MGLIALLRRICRAISLYRGATQEIVHQQGVDIYRGVRTAEAYIQEMVSLQGVYTGIYTGNIALPRHKYRNYCPSKAYIWAQLHC
jgi:hypothetical protein